MQLAFAVAQLGAEGCAYQAPDVGAAGKSGQVEAAVDRAEDDGYTDAVVDGSVATVRQGANDGGASERTAAAARGVGLAGTGCRVGEAHPLYVATRTPDLPYPALAAARVGVLAAAAAVHVEAVEAEEGAAAADAGGGGAGVVAGAGTGPVWASDDRRGRRG